MRIHIDTVANSIVLSDAENFRALDAEIEGPLRKAVEVDGIAHQDDNHVWIDIETLAALSGVQPADWRERFDKMIDYARSKGWVDDSVGAVRAHIRGA